MMGYHRPVLLDESIKGLNIAPGGTYADLTFGGGGHSREVLNQLGKRGRLIVFDQDPDARVNVPDDKRITFIQANFRYLKHFMRFYAVDQLDGILADLGISSHQIDSPERGFSYRTDETLDMRMDRRGSLTAFDVLNSYQDQDLVRIFKSYGELTNARKIAGLIIRFRAGTTIRTAGDLEEALRTSIPGNHPNKFLAKVYQALRIEVNRELDALKEMLIQTPGLIRKGGRLVVITYHSMEDRIVKNFMRSGNLEGTPNKDFYGNVLSPWRVINRNVITPSEEEIRINNRARSAKLRIAERKEQDE